MFLKKKSSLISILLSNFLVTLRCLFKRIYILLSNLLSYTKNKKKIIMKIFMFPVRKKNSLKKNSLLIGRSYIPILDKTSKESYQSYLLSIEEHYNSEEEFYLTKAVERLHPGRLSGLLNALRYILVERPESFDVEELEESE